MKLPLKIQDSSDMDNVQFSVTFKTQKSKGSDSESTISNESDDESFNIDDSEDEFSISNVKPKNIKPITIKKCIYSNIKNSNDS